MAENEENKTIRKVFTIVTSPLWVPVAAVGSLVAAPIQAVKDSKEVAEKTDSDAMGVSSYPGNAVVRIVTNPFKGVVRVGEALWGKDDKWIDVFQRGSSYITDQLNENYVFTYSVLK